jgi:hypothetical protein
VVDLGSQTVTLSKGYTGDVSGQRLSDAVERVVVVIENHYVPQPTKPAAGSRETREFNGQRHLVVRIPRDSPRLQGGKANCLPTSRPGRRSPGAARDDTAALRHHRGD